MLSSRRLGVFAREAGASRRPGPMSSFSEHDASYLKLGSLQLSCGLQRHKQAGGWLAGWLALRGVGGAGVAARPLPGGPELRLGGSGSRRGLVPLGIRGPGEVTGTATRVGGGCGPGRAP